MSRCEIAENGDFWADNPAVKSARDRGKFGTWLREQRTARYENVPTAVRALRSLEGYGIAPSVWAELEAGSRRPSAEQRERLETFFEGSAPTEEGDLSQVLAALNATMQTQTELMREFLAELRDNREATQGRTEGMAAALGELSGTIESLRPLLGGKSRSNNG